jgi:hypothetical protein
MIDVIYRHPVQITNPDDDGVTHIEVHAPDHHLRMKAVYCYVYAVRIEGDRHILTNVMTPGRVRLEAMDRRSGKRLAQLRTDVSNQLRARSGADEKVSLVGEPEFS